MLLMDKPRKASFATRKQMFMELKEEFAVSSIRYHGRKLEASFIKLLSLARTPLKDFYRP